MQVADAVPEFADAFPFEEFNAMQRAAAPVILETDHNVVASAPTASGKTALAELAICKTLQAGGTALFVAPMRALTNEKESEWDRFEELGYSVYVVTGERDLHPGRAERADILVMTPEKLDSATRNHESARYAFIQDIDCCVIDEVHLLDADERGSVLEVTIARLRRLVDPRVVALSATMANVEDVAEWLDAPAEATFDFDDSHRPVELHADVRVYDPGENAFADKYRRLYSAMDLAEPHLRDDGQALVFVASRRDTVDAAQKARDIIAERDIPMGARGDYDFHTDAEALDNEDLRKSVLDGVAFHHAGLSKGDKDRVERWFREGKLSVLFSTSTLAWGVNLPARCVVIRDTNYHDPLEGEVAMSPLDVLQMLGRAGRPGYDDVGYGWVVAHPDDADRYRRLLDEGTPIESRLDERLAAHLNAEIAMGTIGAIDEVGDWLESTFYAVRARSAPAEYDFERLQDRVRETVQDLVERGFVEAGDDLGLAPTALGRLTSRYYLELETAEVFGALAESEADTDAILRAVARAAEFDSVACRADERTAVATVLDGDGEDMADGHRKVLAILRARLDGATPADLSGDAWVIRQNAGRLLAALRAFLAEFDAPRGANLTRRLAARLETGVSADAVGLTAIDGVGATRAERLADAGHRTPADIVAAGADELVRTGLPDGTAATVVENARDAPAPTVEWGAFPEEIAGGENDVREVTVRNRGGGASAHVRVTVNDREMTASETYLGTATMPVGVFGGDAERVTYAVEVVFPDEPLAPYRETRTVTVV
jgi:replicative superfamily II helicase